jgi:hypothetical protein
MVARMAHGQWSDLTFISSWPLCFLLPSEAESPISLSEK